MCLSYVPMLLYTHLAQVYMYDNRSSDKSRDVLRKYEEDGFVLVRDWNVDGAQTEALNDCLYRFRHATRYATGRDDHRGLNNHVQFHHKPTTMFALSDMVQRCSDNVQLKGGEGRAHSRVLWIL